MITFNFDASLDTGALAGTTISGTLSFDETGITVAGTDYVALTSIDFELDGVPFTKANLYQGGQMIIENGYPSYFTAAFLPPPGAPVTGIAFGFGGPGIIGYSTPGKSGMGTYKLAATPRSYVILLLRRILACLSKATT
jgi:hypothetical protein